MEPDEIFNELFGEHEELSDELKEHVFDGPYGKMIHHPFIVQIIYHEHMNAMLNQMLRQKQEHVNEYMKSRNYEGYVFLHERPYRLEALLEIISYLKPEDYWKVVRSVYVDTENAYEFHDEWASVLSADIPVPDEMNVVALRGYNIKIYRGFMHDESVMGFSWTTDYEKAVWFAKRFARDGDVPRVVSGNVNRADILMYIDERGESEVVVLPEHVDVIEVKQV